MFGFKDGIQKTKISYLESVEKDETSPILLVCSLSYGKLARTLYDIVCFCLHNRA